MSLCGEVAATLASDVISHVGAYISSDAKEKALSLVAQHKSLSSENLGYMNLGLLICYV